MCVLGTLVGLSGAGHAHFEPRRTGECSSGDHDWLRSSAEISSINKQLCSL
jgi:hypothetical protein